MSYTQLTQEQRYQVYALLKTGCSQTKIAETIEVHKSTISREVWVDQTEFGVPKVLLERDEKGLY